MNKRIFYLSVYSIEKYKNENRYYPLSAAVKIESIMEALLDCGFSVDIISASLSHGSNKCRGHVEKIKKGVTLHLFSSIGRKNLLTKIGDLIWLYIQLLAFFISNVHRDDTVIVYHSLLYVQMVRFLKKIIGFKMVLEFEEMYADVLKNDKSRNRELSIVKDADCYIFPSRIMPKILGIHDASKYVVIHGTYCTESARNIEKKKNYTHVVYAGTLERRKGSLQAIAAGEFLPENYWIHILGNGSKQDVQMVKNEISRVTLKGKAKVSYDGLMTGEEYIRFLQSCDIGLCTQDSTASFTDTSFPSKILSYLSNGLRVLTVDVPAIRTSDVSGVLFFYKEQNAEAIAEGILSIDSKGEYSGRRIVEELYEKTKTELNRMLVS